MVDESTRLAGRLIAGPFDAPIEHTVITMRSGLVTDIAIGTRARKMAVSAEHVPDDAYLVPGLIDTHCHLVFPGDARWTNWGTQGCASERLLLLAVENCRRALRAGITTLRDLGSPGNLLFALRDSVRNGVLVAPRLLLSGPPLTPTGGHCHDLGGEVDSRDECIKQIRSLHKLGADVIKVMASGGGTPGTSPTASQFSLSELSCMAAEAHRWGVPIVGHATCPEAVRNCVLARFDGIEHAGFWTGTHFNNAFAEELVEEIARNGTYIAPTLQASYRTVNELPGQTIAERDRRRKLAVDAADNFERMCQMDVKLVSGTDAGYMINPFGDLVLGLELMTEHGLSATAAWATATVTAAAALGLSCTIGRIQEGAAADILVVGGDPRKDIRVLRDVRAVFHDGQQVA